MLNVVLVEPQISGNLGAIARVMKNFGVVSLYLVNPKCEIDQECKNRAKHAQDVLENCHIVDSIPKMDVLIGTSGQLGGEYNLSRLPVTCDEVAISLNYNANIGVVFGREDAGLSNDELEACDFLVTVGTSKEYPIMNLSHAVGVVLYEVTKPVLKGGITDDRVAMSVAEKEQLFLMIDEALEKMQFQTEDKKDTQRKVLQRLVTKSFMSKREANSLMGFFGKI